MTKQSHTERTAHEPRGATLHTVTISHITQVSPTIRLFRFALPEHDSITFLPGQWVDLHLPPETGITKAGGFTITSSPTLALSKSSQPRPPIQDQDEDPNHPGTTPAPATPTPTSTTPYIELAIQSSPQNPIAAYLFSLPSTILHTPVQVRVGGRFVFPPPSLLHPVATTSTSTSTSTLTDSTSATSVSPPHRLRKAVLVAGGMGINPLISMLSWIGDQQGGQGVRDSETRVEVDEVRVLYGVKDPRSSTPTPSPNSDGNRGTINAWDILFLDRIAAVFAGGRVKGGAHLFVTGGGYQEDVAAAGRQKGVVMLTAGDYEIPILRRRMSVQDVERAVGDDKEDAVVYVCGVPTMTDEFVEALVSRDGFAMDPERVLFEKWW